MNEIGLRFYLNQFVRTGGGKGRDWNKNLWRLSEAYSEGIDSYNRELLNMHDEAGGTAAMAIHR